MTPAELKAARHELGLSAQGFADLLRIKSGRTVRKWEAGENDIPGPVEIVVGLLLRAKDRAGFIEAIRG